MQSIGICPDHVQYMKLGINMLAKDLQFALLSKHHMSLSEACLPLYTAPVAVLRKRVMRQHHPFIAPGGIYICIWAAFEWFWCYFGTVVRMTPGGCVNPLGPRRHLYMYMDLGTTCMQQADEPSIAVTGHAIGGPRQKPQQDLHSSCLTRSQVLQL